MTAPTPATGKIAVNNMSAVGIIYNATNPLQIFIEAKTSDYPVKAFAGMLLCIGGNYMGTNAKDDKNPHDTYVREIHEELSFDKPAQRTTELSDLVGTRTIAYTVPGTKIEPADQDVLELNTIKAYITEYARWFGDYVQFVPRAIFDVADPNSKREDLYGHCSVFTTKLPQPYWQALVRLQQKFGNLSNESVTIMTSLQEIVDTGWNMAWGQDRVLQEFFRTAFCPNQDLHPADNLPLISGITMTRQDRNAMLPSYQDYLSRYDVAKLP